MNSLTKARRQTLVILFCVVACLPATGAWARQEALLNVDEGQLPNDTGSDKTTFSIEDSTGLGGRALRVVYATGDSFGDRVAKVKDWKPFTTLEFTAYNPNSQDVRLVLTIKHKQTTSFPTRVDVPLTLTPGKSNVHIPINTLQNVNGSAPDLGNVVRWYIACEDGRAPTIDFGNIRLVGNDIPDNVPASANDKTGPPVAYRVKGEIGDMPVDLVVTPEVAGALIPSGIAKPKEQATDPARLARIRATKMPVISQPVPFNTAEADAILGALEVFPPDNAWNQIVSAWPVRHNSQNIIALIGNDKPLRYNPDMGFILVPPDQTRVGVKITDYPSESDTGPYPIPDQLPIEGWPAWFHRDSGNPSATLEDVQRDKLNLGGDRHAIVVDPINRMLYEFDGMRRNASGWQAGQASVFDLKTNKLRPTGWTSADAAGLPIFPAVVRYDELQRGRIDHALRVTVRKTRQDFVAPATHYASRLTDENLPRMGERLRLRQDFNVSGFSPEARTILVALKRYGMLVADNGIEWAISVAPDGRIPILHDELRRVRGSDFEVVVAP
jgi:hypothetical protein